MSRLGRPRFGNHLGVDADDGGVAIPATQVPYGNANGDGLDSEADFNYDAANNTLRQGIAAALEAIVHGAQHTLSGNASGAGTLGSDSYGQLNLRRIALDGSGYILGKIKAWAGATEMGRLAFQAVNTLTTGGARFFVELAGDGTGGTVAGFVDNVIACYESGAVALGLIGTSLGANYTDGFVYVRDMAGAPNDANVPVVRSGQPFTIDNLNDRFWYWGATTARWLKPNMDFQVFWRNVASGAGFAARSTDCMIRYTGAGGDTCTLPVVGSGYGINWGTTLAGRCYIFRNDSAGDLTVTAAGTDSINGGGAGGSLVVAAGTTRAFWGYRSDDTLTHGWFTNSWAQP